MFEAKKLVGTSQFLMIQILKMGDSKFMISLWHG
jgi:hypothetical protein